MDLSNSEESNLLERKKYVYSASPMDPRDWMQLRRVCAEYNSDDDVFDKADIIHDREQSFIDHLNAIDDSLRGITSNGIFKGWIALYQPAKPGIRRVERVITREAAAPYTEECEKLCRDGVAYFASQLHATISVDESPSRKIAYDISHPEHLPRLEIGAGLRAILNYQRKFLVEVLPRWYTNEGDLERAGGLDLGQTLQSGLGREDILEDIGAPPDFGKEGYDLGIDPQFE